MLPKFIKYIGSSYRKTSGNSFLQTVLEKGKYDEFLIFSFLEKLGGHNKLMTNLYLPNKDGSTTEIDLIMISETGIYIFESKSYSGWIFGDEKSKNWTKTQGLQNKKEIQFSNPIWQNKGHISALKAVVEIKKDSLYKSYIIFNERCTLKNINVTSPNMQVIKRNALTKTIKRDIASAFNLMTAEEVDKIYLKLQKYHR